MGAPLPAVPKHLDLHPIKAGGPNSVTLRPLDSHAVMMRTAAPIVKGAAGLAWRVQGFRA